MTALFDALDAVPADTFMLACGALLVVLALTERVVLWRGER